MLIPNLGCATNMVDTCACAAVFLRPIAKVEMDADAFSLVDSSAVSYFVVSIVDISNEAGAGVCVKNGVGVGGKTGVVEEVRSIGSVEGGELEHSLPLRVVEGGQVFNGS